MWGRETKLQKMNKTTEKGTFGSAAKGKVLVKGGEGEMFLVFISQRVVERGNSAAVQCVTARKELS